MRYMVILSVLVLLVLVPLAKRGEGQDAKAALETYARQAGAAGLKTIKYTGKGVSFAVGQSPYPGAPWPRFNLLRLTRSINYEAPSLLDEIVRSQGELPPRGGGGQPVIGEQALGLVVSGVHGWNRVGTNVVPRPWDVTERTLQLFTSPHGVFRAAIALNGTVQSRTEGGRAVTAIAFAWPRLFRVSATLNDRSLVEKVAAVLDHPLVGDLAVETVYSDYQDFGGVQFPTRIRQSQGGFPSLDLTVTEVQPNVPVELQVPDAVRDGAGRVDVRKVAEGVWYFTGGTHHSAAVEMRDHVIVVEGPLYDERAAAVIAEVKQAIPNKPITYLINTHHHFDHAGGVRAFAAEGATILTHEINRAFWERVFAAPRTVRPDRFAQSGRRAAIETVGDRRVLTDGTRTVEVYHLKGNPHHDGLIMAYLPKERLLIEADAYTPGLPNAPPPAQANPFSVNLVENIERLKLGVDHILPLHGRMVPAAELHRAIGRAP